MVLESCFHGFVQDVCFIPMSVSYEKITEEMLYTYELVGIPKPKESLSVSWISFLHWMSYSKEKYQGILFFFSNVLMPSIVNGYSLNLFNPSAIRNYGIH